MGDGPGFWRHWWRGARAIWSFGTVIALTPVLIFGILAITFKGYEWTADQLHLPHLPPFDPNIWFVVAVVAVSSVLLAPAMLSSSNDNKTIFPAWRAGPPASPPRPVAIEVADGFSFLDGVLCEQVRPELGGRWVLLGTYGHAILVPRYPYQVTISGLLNVETTKAFLDPLPARIRLDEQVISLTRLVTDGEVKSWTIELIPRVVDVTGPATFHIDVSIDGETWTEVMRKPVYAPDEGGGS